MRRIVITLLAAFAFACASNTPPPPPVAARFSPPPPPTEKKPVTETLNGVGIIDPYRWLEDQNSPETRAWIDRENAYTDVVLGNRPEKQLFAPRIEQLLKSDQVELSLYRNGRIFYARRAADADVFSLYMREGLHGADKLLVDPAPWNPKHTTNVGFEDITPDGKMIAYNVREGGADEVTVRFLDVDTGREIGARLPLARYFGVSVTPDHRTVYYSKQLPEGSRIFRRSIDGGAEEKLFGDGYSPDKIVSIGTSDDGRWLGVVVYYGSAGTKTDVFLKDLASPDSPFKTVVNDLDARTSMEFAGDTLVLETNWNAPNERVMIASPAEPTHEHWREIVPENKNAAIDGFGLAGGRIYVRYLENVKPRVVGYDIEGRQVDEIVYDTLGNGGGIEGSWSSPQAFYSFSSFAVPPTIYAYNVQTKEKSVFHRRNLPVNPDEFVTEQVWYTSKDGTKVPMFVMYKKGTPLDGTAPAYLTGYGGFNLSSLPNFSTRAVIWAEHGGVYALANLRGGGEFGEAWHRAGMLGEKQHVFDDFIGAAEWLIANKYTTTPKLAIQGGSNGGLLVGACETQRPDLFGACLPAVGVMDMLRFQKFTVGFGWVGDYGSSEDAEQFKALRAYSPYHNIKPGTCYPPTLVTTADHDDRVYPAHSFKFAAAMQKAQSCDNPVLIRIETRAGHGAGKPTSKRIDEIADTWAFLVKALKMNPQLPSPSMGN